MACGLGLVPPESHFITPNIVNTIFPCFQTWQQTETMLGLSKGQQYKTQSEQHCPFCEMQRGRYSLMCVDEMATQSRVAL